MIGDLPPSLRDHVIAGLRLSALTARLLAPIFAPDDAPLIARTAERLAATSGA